MIHWFFILLLVTNFGCADNIIDVVIPCHKKDQRTLDLVIDGIRRNGKNIRRIITISSTPLTKNAEWFDEILYPFSKEDILKIIFDGNAQLMSNYLNNSNNRLGWIFQQLLKLYAPLIIPGISENVLIIDADTIFLNPVEFIDEAGNALYGTGSEYHRPYFEHGKKILDDFHRVFSQYSGICHHMLFQKNIVEQLFNNIEKKHGCQAWIALCRNVEKSQLYLSGISEYELYFNYVFVHFNTVKIRQLQWKNIRFDMQDIQRAQKDGYHYVSCHEYMG